MLYIKDIVTIVLSNLQHCKKSHKEHNYDIIQKKNFFCYFFIMLQ
jgi:hypothetical protein